MTSEQAVEKRPSAVTFSEQNSLGKQTSSHSITIDGFKDDQEPSKDSAYDLSATSKLYDRDHKGYLDPVEKSMRSMDKSNRGFITQEKIYKVIEEHITMQRTFFKLKRVVVGLSIMVLVLSLSNLATGFAAARLAKDTTTDSESGNLMLKGTNNVVGTRPITTSYDIDMTVQSPLNSRRLGYVTYQEKWKNSVLDFVNKCEIEPSRLKFTCSDGSVESYLVDCDNLKREDNDQRFSGFKLNNGRINMKIECVDSNNSNKCDLKFDLTPCQTSRTVYVAPTHIGTPGETLANAADDEEHGTREYPFKTVTYAAEQVGYIPGSTIVLLDGYYENESYGDGRMFKDEVTVDLSSLLHGTEDQPITIKADTSNHLLRGDGYHIFKLRAVYHVIVENLIIEGEVQRINLEEARKEMFTYMIDDEVRSRLRDNIDYDDAETENLVARHNNDELEANEMETLNFTNIANMVVTRPSLYTTTGLLVLASRNVIVRNCKVSFMPGVGLRVQNSDWVKIQSNEVHDNSRRGSVGNHGLVVHSISNIINDEFEGSNANDYRIEVTGNWVHDNYNELYSWSSKKVFITPHIDEGKGITIQKSSPTQSDFDTGRILAANNYCHDNGFAGIGVNSAHRVDIYHNTIVNNTKSEKGGNTGISIAGGEDVNVVNNIAIAVPDNVNHTSANALSTSSDDLDRDDIVFRRNIVVGKTSPVIVMGINGNKLATNDDAKLKDGYKIRATSDAVDYGTNQMSISVAVGQVDIDGNSRDATPDCGAYERTN